MLYVYISFLRFVFYTVLNLVFFFVTLWPSIDGNSKNIICYELKQNTVDEFCIVGLNLMPVAFQELINLLK